MGIGLLLPRHGVGESAFGALVKAWQHKTTEIYPRAGVAALASVEVGRVTQYPTEVI